MTTPLRFHLMIGPPASGKSTVATLLAPMLGAELIATDDIRAQLYGDSAVQGLWPEVEQELHRRIRAAMAAGRPVLVDATHVHRPWRLALTQGMALPLPLQWVGWWLRTPREVCLAWNQQRSRAVLAAVIAAFADALDDPSEQPDRSEGFAALVQLDPSTAGDLRARLQRELEGLVVEEGAP